MNELSITESNDRSGYEDLPYPSYTFPQTSPDRLSTMGILHGMTPPDPANCRYIELGCGNGTNVAAMASMFPQGDFVGIDLSQTHINSAKKLAAEISIENAEFIVKNILDIDVDSLGQFDYIVAHGLFSWIPEIVRTKVLELIKACLAPNGVAYISYNALPGCYVRQIGWDLMQLRTSKIANIEDKITSAIDVLSLVGKESVEGSLSKGLYKTLISNVSTTNRANVFHDDLTPGNKPFYFLDFVELIRRYGMKFVCEAEPESLSENSISKTAKLELDKIASDPLEREQYIDFIDFAQFRMSIICRADIELSSSPDPAQLTKLYARSSLSAKVDDELICSADRVNFVDVDGRSMAVNHPLTKVALQKLGSSNPESIRINELMAQSEGFLRSNGVKMEGEDVDRTLQFFLDLYVARLLSLFANEPVVANAPGEKPQVLAFNRWQAANGCECITSRLGENVGMSSDLVRATITMLDGTHDRKTLAKDLLTKMNIPESDFAEAESQLPAVIDKNLSRFAELGLLVQ